MDVVVLHWVRYPDDADASLVGERIDGVVDAVVGVVVVFVVADDEACAVWVAVMERQPSIRRFCNENPVPIVWNMRLKLKRAIHNDRCWYVDLHYVTSECVLDMYLARLNLKWVIRISRV